mgnify:CR=1 FL=1
MSTVIRRLVTGTGHGNLIRRVSSPVANSASSIVASIHEVDSSGSPFVGSARMTVHNIAPRPTGYDIWVEVSWDQDLNWEIDVLISND